MIQTILIASVSAFLIGTMVGDRYGVSADYLNEYKKTAEEAIAQAEESYKNAEESLALYDECEARK